MVETEVKCPNGCPGTMVEEGEDRKVWFCQVCGHFEEAR